MLSRLDYDKKVNTPNINVHICNMSLGKLCNGYVTKTTKSKAFQTDNIYVPIGTHMFANQLKPVHANYSTIAFVPREDYKKKRTEHSR